MKNRTFVPDWSILFFLLTVSVALFSWVGSIYGFQSVQSLLSAEGIRWVLSHIVENYVQVPALGCVLILLMGLGIGERAGLSEVLKRLLQRDRQLSGKERRALVLSFVSLFLYAGVVLLSMILPWNFLQSITGSWINSPLSKGLVYILSVGVGLPGIVYGYVSDTFRSVSDVINGMSCLIARKASYFVSLFFVVQFFSSLEYTGLLEWMNVDSGVVEFLYPFFCFLPLFVMKKKKG